MDWTVAHALNSVLVGRDWLEDPVTAGASAAVPMFAAASFGLWLLARPGRDPMWKRACLSALLSASLALAANQLLAHVVWARPRPFTAHPDQVHLFAAASLDPSFPSDHAAAAFAIAVAVLFYSRRVGLAFVAVAALIAVSRVVEGLHYPSDVLAGAAVGAIAAIVVTRVGQRLVERLADTLAIATDPIVARVGSALVGLRHRG